MKIKLLAATVLFLALGINTTEAQNRQRTKEQNQYGQQGRKGGGEYSKQGKWNKERKNGNFKKGDRMMQRKHYNEYRRDKRHNRRFRFHKSHHRSHRF